MSGRRHVMVVEDSTTQRAQISRILELSGYEVTALSSAESVPSELKLIDPTAIVLDIIMPGMNGFELCRRIREDSTYGSVPIVLLTSLSDCTDVLRGLESGADSFVVKPCDDDFLPRLISTLTNEAADNFEPREDGRIRFVYRGQEFLVSGDQRRMLKLLVSSFESAAELNRRLSEAHAKLSAQAALLKRKVDAQAFQIDQQVEERRNVESQLYHYQRMEAVDRLAGTVAHDFNNMLMVIQGFTDFLLKDSEEGGREHKFLSEIRKASDRAAELTDQLLIFSRKQEFAEEDFDLNRLVLDIHSMLTSILGDEVKTVFDLADSELMVRLDKHQIEQVIVNLATNARDAMPSGGVCTFKTWLYESKADGSNLIEGLPDSTYVCISIADSGCGMPREVLEHIYEPFYTTKEKGKGTGLGLSTVFGVVRKSGGQIFCTSVPDEGTTFVLYLPIGTSVDEEHHG